MFKIGQQVTYKGQKMTVESVSNNGRSATICAEIIPFMPVRCVSVNVSEVQF